MIKKLVLKIKEYLEEDESKYEVCVKQYDIKDVGLSLKKMQELNWTISGATEIIKSDDNSCIWIVIPFKRKIKE